MFTFISYGNEWYGNLVYWDESASSLKTYDETHYCNELPDLETDPEQTGVCCLGTGVPVFTTYTNCPGFFVPDYISEAYGFTGVDRLKVCGLPTGPYNSDAVGPCCVYNEKLDPAGINGEIENQFNLGSFGSLNPPLDINFDPENPLQCFDNMAPDECLAIGYGNEDLFSSFNEFNDYMPDPDPDSDPGCGQVNCINSIFDVGACCDGHGNCTEVNQYVCEETGGFFRGKGIPCTDTLCSGGTGACCTFGSCVDGVEADTCISGGSKYAGKSSRCSTTTCPVTVNSSYMVVGLSVDFTIHMVRFF